MDNNTSSEAAARAGATLVIWLAVTVLGAAVLANSATLGGLVVLILMIVMLAAAGSATMAIWRARGMEHTEEKAKRRTMKIEHMLNHLSDDELDELRSRLTSDDGEQVSLEELLAARETAKREL